MVINHGGALKKDYFISYLRLIMNVKICNVDVAREVAFQKLFRNNKETLGKESYQQFVLAYEEISKSRNNQTMK